MITSSNPESEESYDNFQNPMLQHTFRDTNENNGLSPQIFVDTSVTYSFIHSDEISQITRVNQSLTPLEKSTLARNRQAMPMKVVIQPVFDVQNTCVIEHMVYVSYDARMNIHAL